MLRLHKSPKKQKRGGKSSKQTGRGSRSKGFLLSRQRFSLKYLIVAVVALAAIGGTAIYFSSAATSTASIYYNYDNVIQFNDINQTRQSAGKGTLTESSCLDQEAQAWSAHMASTGVLAHPADTGGDISNYCGSDWTSFAQNVGSGNCAGVLPDTCPQDIYNAFMGSSEHKANILGGYTRVGVGTVRKGSVLWITQTFATCAHCTYARWLPPTLPTTNVPSGWIAWTNWLGGNVTSGVGVVSRAPGLVQAFARGANNNIYTIPLGGSWTNLGGCTTLAPSVTAMPDHTMYMFMRNCDNTLQYKKWTASGWSGWTSPGYFMTSAPSAAVWQNGNRMDVFFRGADHTILDWVWTSSKGWQSYLVRVGTNAFDSAPAAVSWQGGNRLNLYARGSDGKIYEATMAAGGSWGSWHTISNASLQGDPTVAAWQGGNSLALFARGQDNSIWSLSYANGKWATSWQTLDGICIDSPGATSSRSNSLIVFCRNQNNQLAYKYLNAYW